MTMYLPFLRITEFLRYRVNRSDNRVSLEARVSYNNGESLCDGGRTCLLSGSMRREGCNETRLRGREGRLGDRVT